MNGIVLPLLAGFSIWAALATHGAADQVRLSTGERNADEAARYAVGAEESLERKYRLQPSPEIRARHAAAAASLMADLTWARGVANQTERAASIDEVMSIHTEYLGAVARMFAMVDVGDLDAVNQFDVEVVDPLFGVIDERVNAAADRFDARAQQDLAYLNDLSNIVLTLTPVVFSIGFVLIALVTARALQGRLADATKHNQTLTYLNDTLRQLTARVVEAQEDERRRLALELHDDPLQRAALLAADLASAPEQNDRTRRWRAAAEEIAMALRAACTGLRPPMLDDLGLVPSVEALTNTLRIRTDLAVEVSVASPGRASFGRLAPTLELALYRAVQEALSNIQKHARARVVSIWLSRDDEHVEVGVQDDGCGFDPAAKPGVGLHGIRERIAPWGGVLTTTSSTDGGTRVTVDVPLAQLQHANGWLAQRAGPKAA